jgi:hypothetical protein
VNAQDYHRQLVELFDSITLIVESDVSFREIDTDECYIKATLTWATGHILYLAEYVMIQSDEITRSRYRYQLLTPDKKPIIRWDNAPHHKSLSTFPEHQHDATGLPYPSHPMTPADAIAETLSLIESNSK